MNLCRSMGLLGVLSGSSLFLNTQRASAEVFEPSGVDCAARCLELNPDEPCHTDAACLDCAVHATRCHGCNAAGLGQDCQFCGFDSFPECNTASLSLPGSGTEGEEEEGEDGEEGGSYPYGGGGGPCIEVGEPCEAYAWHSSQCCDSYGRGRSSSSSWDTLSSLIDSDLSADEYTYQDLANMTRGVYEEEYGYDRYEAYESWSPGFCIFDDDNTTINGDDEVLYSSSAYSTTGTKRAGVCGLAGALGEACSGRHSFSSCGPGLFCLEDGTCGCIAEGESCESSRWEQSSCCPDPSGGWLYGSGACIVEGRESVDSYSSSALISSTGICSATKGKTGDICEQGSFYGSPNTCESGPCVDGICQPCIEDGGACEATSFDSFNGCCGAAEASDTSGSDGTFYTSFPGFGYQTWGYCISAERSNMGFSSDSDTTTAGVCASSRGTLGSPCEARGSPADSSCEGHLFCLDGTCQNCIEEGAPCSGHYWYNNACCSDNSIESSSSSSSGGGRNGFCISDSSTDSSTEFSTVGVCKASPGKAGDACEGDSGYNSCSDSLNCVEGVCEECIPSGSPCEAYSWSESTCCFEGSADDYGYDSTYGTSAQGNYSSSEFSGSRFYQPDGFCIGAGSPWFSSTTFPTSSPDYEEDRGRTLKSGTCASRRGAVGEACDGDAGAGGYSPGSTCQRGLHCIEGLCRGCIEDGEDCSGYHWSESGCCGSDGTSSGEMGGGFCISESGFLPTFPSMTTGVCKATRGGQGDACEGDASGDSYSSSCAIDLYCIEGVCQPCIEDGESCSSASWTEAAGCCGTPSTSSSGSSWYSTDSENEGGESYMYWYRPTGSCIDASRSASSSINIPFQSSTPDVYTPYGYPAWERPVTVGVCQAAAGTLGDACEGSGGYSSCDREAGFVCIGGVCDVLGAVGDACEGDVDNSTCAERLVCVDGECEECGQEGETCTGRSWNYGNTCCPPRGRRGDLYSFCVSDGSEDEATDGVTSSSSWYSPYSSFGGTGVCVSSLGSLGERCEGNEDYSTCKRQLLCIEGTCQE